MRMRIRHDRMGGARAGSSLWRTKPDPVAAAAGSAGGELSAGIGPPPGPAAEWHPSSPQSSIFDSIVNGPINKSSIQRECPCRLHNFLDLPQVHHYFVEPCGDELDDVRPVGIANRLPEADMRVAVPLGDRVV